MASRLVSFWARSSPQLRFSIACGWLAVVVLWFITPNSGALFHPMVRAKAAGTDLYGLNREGSNQIINSIIVPAYNEAPNMVPLVTRIFKALSTEQARQTEILIIDDNSGDNTSEEIDKLKKQGYNVHLHVRTLERGLSSAVLHGFTLARGTKLLVMDADMQHPPETVPMFIDALESRRDVEEHNEAPLFALGTRYGKGVEMDKDWPVYRRIISWGARMLSRPLTSAEDPMGGFFALKKELFLAAQPLNPSGFKIGLELLLKSPLPAHRLTHVPYGFAKRQIGSSKLGMKVIVKYIGQLLALYKWKFNIFFPMFVAVAVTLAIRTLLVLVQIAIRSSGRSQSSLGRLLTGDRTKRRKAKSDV